MWWSESMGRIELQITKAQAQACSHPGDCLPDVLALRQVSKIRRQLAKLKPETVAACLRDTGGWETEELQDHDKNLTGLLWLACCDIAEGLHR